MRRIRRLHADHIAVALQTYARDTLIARCGWNSYDYVLKSVYRVCESRNASLEVIKERRVERNDLLLVVGAMGYFTDLKECLPDILSLAEAPQDGVEHSPVSVKHGLEMFLSEMQILWICHQNCGVNRFHFKNHLNC
eukprot:XP_001705175.1 Hypothetical protein GL50803_19057 [Giardia lamblia ATCC 50803]